MRHADVILVLDQGRLVERGSHDALMAKDGVYARLVRPRLGVPHKTLEDLAPAAAPIAEFR